MEKTTKNQVKQILMNENELGLTRESIRELANELVEDTVRTHINKMTEKGIIRQAVQDCINIEIRSNAWSKDDLSSLAKSEMESAMKDLLDKHLGLSVTWSGDT